MHPTATLLSAVVLLVVCTLVAHSTNSTSTSISNNTLVVYAHPQGITNDDECSPLVPCSIEVAAAKFNSSNGTLLPPPFSPFSLLSYLPPLLSLSLLIHLLFYNSTILCQKKIQECCFCFQEPTYNLQPSFSHSLIVSIFIFFTFL
jgi:hypothetical protein